MRHFPAFCAACQRVFLAAEVDAARPACPRCSELGRLVPSAFYQADAALTFEDAEQLLFKARLSEAQARFLIDELSRPEAAEGRRDSVERALAQVPGLAPLQQLLTDEPAEVRRLTGMLLTILTPLLAPAVTVGSGTRPVVLGDLFAVGPRKTSSAS